MFTITVKRTSRSAGLVEANTFFKESPLRMHKKTTKALQTR